MDVPRLRVWDTEDSAALRLRGGVGSIMEDRSIPPSSGRPFVSNPSSVCLQSLAIYSRYAPPSATANYCCCFWNMIIYEATKPYHVIPCHALFLRLWSDAQIGFGCRNIVCFHKETVKKSIFITPLWERNNQSIRDTLNTSRIRLGKGQGHGPTTGTRFSSLARRRRRLPTTKLKVYLMTIPPTRKGTR